MKQTSQYDHIFIEILIISFGQPQGHLGDPLGVLPIMACYFLLD
jgi:hypothetical protein